MTGVKEISGGVTAPQGFKASGVKAGIKKSGKEDIALIYSTVPANVAAMFTTNAFAAAPVVLSRQNAAGGKARAIVVNSGCANACTGKRGEADAAAMAATAAAALGIADSEVLVASTGVIGEYMPMEKVERGIWEAAKSLTANGSDRAMQAIMTTDTFPKTCAFEFSIGGKTARLGGIAKGSGMIYPNMATMLCFLTTDAAVSPPVLKKALKEAVDASFHCTLVDGDTSTNDMICLLANGLAGNPVIEASEGDDYAVFAGVLKKACLYLAQQVVRDGEGATKFLAVTVRGAADAAAAKQAAVTIAKSPLVKTAFFGEDPNWGRVLCAVGYSGIEVDPAKVSLDIGGLKIVEAGMEAPADPGELKKIMAARDIDIVVSLGDGPGEATVWTCDFSYEYVKINGEYRT